MSEERHLQLFRAETARVSQFGEIEARWIVDAEGAGSEQIAFGKGVYAPGAGIERHYHPNAEEIVLVLSGRARHVVGDRSFEMGPGDVCFIPRGAHHSLECISDDGLEILWAWGGASSVDAAGFVPVD